MSLCAVVAAQLAGAHAEEALPEGRSWAAPAAAAAEAAAAKTSAAPVAAAAASPGEREKGPPAVAEPAAASAPALPVPPTPEAVVAPAKTATAPQSTPAPAAPASAVSDKLPAITAPETKEKSAKRKKPPSARELFGAVTSPAPLAARAIGWYAKGCLAGAKGLAIDGPSWQVMRLSRNRYWGHPSLIALVERLANEAKAANEWPGLLVGDLAQPRGGPMTSGHASHQVGLDADVWLTSMPDRRLTEKEREDISATSMLADDDVSVNPKVWGDGQVKLIKRAASYPEVERVLVHPAIKKALCEAAGTDRQWLSKVRPYWGHYYHMHIRIGCPKGSTTCRSQPSPPGDDGCGAELTDWLKRIAPPKTPKKEVAEPAKPAKKKPDILLADLPAECRTVLAAGESKPPETAVAAEKSATKKGKVKKTAAQR